VDHCGRKEGKEGRERRTRPQGQQASEINKKVIIWKEKYARNAG
jgi:hypothetical protein